ncbi:hypothetical protein ACNTMW_34010, partial [Planosporangium sp. 12N6]
VRSSSTSLGGRAYSNFGMKDRLPTSIPPAEAIYTCKEEPSTKPWRAREAERLLLGGPADEAAFRRSAEAEMAAAAVRQGNAFKVALAISTIVATLRELSKEAAPR